MCGIITVVRRRTSRPVPTADELTVLLDEAAAALPTPEAVSVETLEVAGNSLEALDLLLRGEAGLRAMGYTGEDGE